VSDMGWKPPRPEHEGEPRLLFVASHEGTSAALDITPDPGERRAITINVKRGHDGTLFIDGVVIEIGEL
jgi:hypothetical protein